MMKKNRTSGSEGELTVNQKEVIFEYIMASAQFSSVTQSCLTLCDPMNHGLECSKTDKRHQISNTENQNFSQDKCKENHIQFIIVWAS